MATKKTASKTKKTPAKKTVKSPSKKQKGMKKGTKLSCGVCGLVVSVDEVCGCVETCDIICCGEQMSKKK